MQITIILMLGIISILSGCQNVPYKELVTRRQEFKLPEERGGDFIHIYFITPYGYYLPSATYDIKLDEKLIQIVTGSYNSVAINRQKNSILEYQYYYYFFPIEKVSDTARSDWKSHKIKFDSLDKRLFLFFRDVRVSELTEQEAIDEMIKIDYYTEHYSSARKYKAR